MNKETSSRVSSIAAEILQIEPPVAGDAISAGSYNLLLEKAQTVAGSALVQDETPGQSKQAHGIHPAPAEFSEAQIASDPVLHFFHYAHLPPQLQFTSRRFFELAYFIVDTVPRTAERTVALRKLLEAKDAAVRANLPAPKLSGETARPTEPELGEPREIGGHDEDRDGPVPFDA